MLFVNLFVLITAGGEIQDLAVAESGVAPSFEPHPEIVSGKMNMTSGTVYSKCQAIQKSESEHEENEQVTDIKVQRIRTPSDENLHRSGSPQVRIILLILTCSFVYRI